jgi:hypothetical protein
VNSISQEKSNTTNMQGVIILKYEHKFGTYKYISDLCHPTQRIQLHIHIHSDFMDPSSVQWQLEYEIGYKQKWIVIYSLILETDINKYH